MNSPLRFCFYLDYSPDRSLIFMAKRTPRNYFGVQNPAKQLGDLLPEILSEIGHRCSDEKGAIFQFWMTLLGEKMAPLTEPLSWADGVLTVKVKSATLYSLLCQHEKARLLEKLRARFPIRNLVFRI